MMRPQGTMPQKWLLTGTLLLGLALLLSTVTPARAEVPACVNYVTTQSYLHYQPCMQAVEELIRGGGDGLVLDDVLPLPLFEAFGNMLRGGNANDIALGFHFYTIRKGYDAFPTGWVMEMWLSDAFKRDPRRFMEIAQAQKLNRDTVLKLVATPGVGMVERHLASYSEFSLKWRVLQALSTSFHSNYVRHVYTAMHMDAKRWRAETRKAIDAGNSADGLRASSVLVDDSFLYWEENLVDHNPDTVWCEGVKGTGEGAYLDYRDDAFSARAEGGADPATSGREFTFYVQTGVHLSDVLFMANGTPHVFEVQVRGKDRIHGRHTREIKPVMGEQIFSVKASRFPKGSHFRIILKKVRPGSKYEDACLSELRIRPVTD